MAEPARFADTDCSDLSERFTTLLSQNHAANKVLLELTPLESIADADALDGWVRMVTGKVTMMTDEMTRLHSKLTSECTYRD